LRILEMQGKKPEAHIPLALRLTVIRSVQLPNGC
jgi:hypothetical protein